MARSSIYLVILRDRVQSLLYLPPCTLFKLPLEGWWLLLLVRWYSLHRPGCIEIGDATSAWLWIQKGKARSLSDVFGPRAIISSNLLEAIRQDPRALELYERKRKSVENATHASAHAYIGAMRKVTADRQAMKEIPILAQLLSIREGAFNITFETSSLESSLELSQMRANNLKYVDWYLLQDSKGALEIIVLLVRDLSAKTSFRQLQITASEVKQWIQKVFHYPEGAEAELKRKSGNRTLWELNGLLEGLDEMTAADDLLILSPSSILNSIPLHGLKVGGKVLIDRNLIIYSSNAAVFRQCQARASASTVASETSSLLTDHSEITNCQKAFFAVYEDDSVPGVEERCNIFENVTTIAQDFNGTAKLGQEVSNAAFTKACCDAQWVHYHGHAVYDEEDVLKSGLVLSDANLTVPNIFNSKLMHNSPHITIIACDSGTQRIDAGDEPLGIVPALLFAGATSVLGYIWPIESWAGRRFSDMFYKHLLRSIIPCERGSNHYEIVNLAAALREVVREMMDKKSVETRLPYFWAPFVLHGCWFHVLNRTMPHGQVGHDG